MKHIINKSNFQNHLDLALSPDTDNLNVLIGILKESDLVKSAPWITLLLLSVDSQKIKTITDEIPILKDKHTFYVNTTNEAYELFISSKTPDQDAIDYLINRYARLTEAMLRKSGSSFLENEYELIIRKKNESKSS